MGDGVAAGVLGAVELHLDLHLAAGVALAAGGEVLLVHPHVPGRAAAPLQLHLHVHLAAAAGHELLPHPADHPGEPGRDRRGHRLAQEAAALALDAERAEVVERVAAVVVVPLLVPLVGHVHVAQRVGTHPLAAGAVVGVALGRVVLVVERGAEVADLLLLAGDDLHQLARAVLPLAGAARVAVPAAAREAVPDIMPRVQVQPRQQRAGDLHVVAVVVVAAAR